MDTGAISNTPGNKTNIFATKRTNYGDNPFLQLLVAEMKAQTPLDPVDNASFMNQMAQFSSMEEQKKLNQNLLKLLQFQGSLARLEGLSQGSSMIGREVTYVYGKEGKTASGKVTGVEIDENGEVMVRLGDRRTPLSSVIAVEGETKKEGGK